MFSIKNKIIGAIILLIIGFITFFTNRFVNTYTIFQKKSEIVELQKNSAKSDSLKKVSDSLKVVVNKTVFELNENVAVSDKITTEFQILVQSKDKEIKRLKSIENACCEEIRHYESNGMIKHDTVYMKFDKKFLKKGEWIEVPKPSVSIKDLYPKLTINNL